MLINITENDGWVCEGMGVSCGIGWVWFELNLNRERFGFLGWIHGGWVMQRIVNTGLQIGWVCFGLCLGCCL